MTTTTYSTPGTYSFVVPDQCTSIAFDLKGAGGGAGINTGSSQQGGHVVGTLTVTPGQVVTVNVGGKGLPPKNNTTTDNLGGFNGGGKGGRSSAGNGGGSGGGATDIRTGGTALSNRKAVAAGGGGIGGGLGNFGGPGGTNIGGQGGSTNAERGLGGTQSAGGAHGTPSGGASDNATDGALGVGGIGSAHSGAGYCAGGGGGGGYYGGGGAGGTSGSPSAGGGGGGSNYVGGLTASTVNDRNGSLRDANGVAVLTYNVAPSAPTFSSPTPPTGLTTYPFDHTLAVTLIYSHNDPDGGVMSRMDYRYRIGTGAWTEIDSFAFINLSGTTYLSTIAGGAFDAFVNNDIELQLRTYDPLGAVSPWSNSQKITPRNAPAAATIVAPTAGPISSTTPVLSWTTPAGMIAFQVEINRTSDGANVWLQLEIDTPSLPTSWSAVLGSYAFVDHSFYYLSVRWQQYSGVWSSWARTTDLEAVLTSPLQPTLQLSADPGTATISVTVTNPGSDPHAPIFNRLYRSDLARPEEGDMLLSGAIPVNGSFTDPSPASRHTYRYRAEAVTGTGAFTSSE